MAVFFLFLITACEKNAAKLWKSRLIFVIMKMSLCYYMDESNNDIIFKIFKSEIARLKVWIHILKCQNVSLIKLNFGISFY